MSRSFDVIQKLSGKTLATAESLTGGAIGAALTAVPGSSAVYKGGVVSYTDEIKSRILGVSHMMLQTYGAVSEPVAGEMVTGVRHLICSDVAVSVTGLAGPGGDEFGNPVGTVYIGYADYRHSITRKYLFDGDREAVRTQAIDAALELILQNNA